MYCKQIKRNHDNVEKIIFVYCRLKSYLICFSGMSVKEELYVSKIVQKAFIEVNEEGSEAAAATAGIMMARMAVLNPLFRCDKPFLYLIKDNLTGLVLFAGRVSDPSKN